MEETGFISCCINGSRYHTPYNLWPNFKVLVVTVQDGARMSSPDTQSDVISTQQNAIIVANWCRFKACSDQRFRTTQGPSSWVKSVITHCSLKITDKKALPYLGKSKFHFSQKCCYMLIKNKVTSSWSPAFSSQPKISFCLSFPVSPSWTHVPGESLFPDFRLLHTVGSCISVHKGSPNTWIALDGMFTSQSTIASSIPTSLLSMKAIRKRVHHVWRYLLYQRKQTTFYHVCGKGNDSSI